MFTPTTWAHAPSRVLIAVALTVLCLVSSAQAYSPPDNWELREHENGELYYLYIPSDWEESGSYPMVLALHGCCWDGITPTTPNRDPIFAAFHTFEENTQRVPTFIIKPHSESGWINKGDNIMEIVNDIRAEFPIDDERIILTGFSMGGAGALDFLNTYPDTFAGSLMVAAAIGNVNTLDPENFENVPIWAAAGSEDGWQENMENAVAYIRGVNGFEEDADPTKYGIFPRYTSLQGAGHGPAMEGLFGMPEAIDWAYSLRKDGNAMPMIWFTEPTPESDAILNASTTSITMSADAKDDGEIASVEFFVDGESVATFTEEPYEYTVENLTPGDHLIEARVVDNGIEQGFDLDKENLARRRISIGGTLEITAPSELPSARVGDYYEAQLDASGANGESTWRVASGSELPQGLRIATRGVLQGIFTSVGDYTFELQLTDAKESPVTKEFSVSALPARPNQPVMEGIRLARAAVPIDLGVFKEGKPWGTDGYGYPVGSFDRLPHPRFDTIWDSGDLEGATMLLAPSLGIAINATTEEWITFETDIPLRIHIAYPENPEIPSWMEDAGFEPSGMEFDVYRTTFTDYVQDYPAGEVVLGPNTESGMDAPSYHYLLILEPARDIPNEYPWSVSEWDGTWENPANTWLGEVQINRGFYPWVRSMDHGWLYVFGSSSEDLWWYEPVDGYWWSSDALYPWLYRHSSSGWFYYWPGSRNPAWYYDIANGNWVSSDDLAE